MPKQDKEYFSKDYYFGKKNSNYADYRDWDKNSFWARPIKLIEKYKISGNLLDIGCAFGYFLKRAEGFFDEVYGLDISEFALATAKKTVNNAIFAQWDLDNEKLLPYEDKYFDLITAFDVLEHTKSFDQSLAKIIPKLKDNGYLMLGMPIKDSLTGRWFKLRDIDKSHVYIPTKKELMGSISKHGFKIVELNPYLNNPYRRINGIGENLEILLKFK
jgi:2-polyprenyl-3-methyl-5-hydroxy-6-metoxy-1,4-benzoquinol methylase